MDNNEITTIPHKAFKELENLETLTLNNNRIHHIDANAFPKLLRFCQEFQSVLLIDTFV